MSADPAFSIVLPTYSRPRLLERAVASVLVQTFDDFELLIVDDASPDETPALVATWSDRRIVYLRCSENRGSAAARNVGIGRARGRTIAFLDDDDEFLPGFLQATHEILADAPEAVGFSWCGVREVRDRPDGGETLLRERKWERYREGVAQDPDPPHVLATGFGLAVRAGCFHVVGLFDETLRACVDTDFLLRLGQRFGYRVVPHVLIKCHHHASGRLTDLTPERAAAYRQILTNHAVRLRTLPVLRVSMQRKLARICYRLGRRFEGRRILWQALHGPQRLTTLRQFAALELVGPPGMGWRRRIYDRVVDRESPAG